MSMLSNKLKNVKISQTAKIQNLAIAKIRQGKNVISLSVGEPDFETHHTVKKAAIHAIKKGYTKYTATDGIFELKMEISKKLLQEKRLSFSDKQLIVSSGGKQVVFNALMATINKEDEVLFASPYWVSYPEIVELCGGRTVVMETSIGTGYKIKPSQLENSITKDTKWLILNSPANPTGAVYTERELYLLSEVLLKFPKIMILSDDIYEKITYDGKECLNIAQVEPKLEDRILIVNGVSKSHAMTGWRIGYGAGPQRIIESMKIIQSQSTSNPCSISQYAALEALSGNNFYLDSNLTIYQERRNLIVRLLNSIEGIDCPNPDGSFYVYPSIEKIMNKRTPKGNILRTDQDFAYFLLQEKEVAIVPGSAFGLSPHFRASFATEITLIIEACDRIKKFVNSLT